MREYLNITNECNLELMKRYEDNHFDLAIVDPPYGININVSMGRRKGDKKSDYHKFAGNDNAIPTAEYFNELMRVSKNQVVFGGNYMTEFLKPSSCWLLWDKGFSEDVTFAQFEMAWTSFKSSAKKYDKHPSQQNRIHPTQKPTSLYQWILTRYAEKGFKILDTHLGSGSIAIAVDSVNKIEKLDLTLTGCELDKKYFDKAINRIEEQTKWNSLF
tara:strand:+ start:1490 stop:2134 length:645 start_codon:yes stop_codon:yes gene_type:complete